MNILTVKEDLCFDGTLNEFKNFLRLKLPNNIEHEWCTMTECYCCELLPFKIKYLIEERGIEVPAKVFIEAIELSEEMTLIKLRTKIRKLDVFIIISFGLVTLGNFTANGISTFFPYFFGIAAFLLFSFSRYRDGQLLDYIDRVIIVRSII